MKSLSPYRSSTVFLWIPGQSLETIYQTQGRTVPDGYYNTGYFHKTSYTSSSLCNFESNNNGLSPVSELNNNLRPIKCNDERCSLTGEEMTFSLSSTKPSAPLNIKSQRNSRIHAEQQVTYFGRFPLNTSV